MKNYCTWLATLNYEIIAYAEEHGLMWIVFFILVYVLSADVVVALWGCCVLLWLDLHISHVFHKVTS